MASSRIARAAQKPCVKKAEGWGWEGEEGGRINQDSSMLVSGKGTTIKVNQGSCERISIQTQN